MDGQLYLFIDEPITVNEIFEAYYDCRKHKRTSPSALDFEVDLENNLFRLLDEINSWSYKPRPYNCFIIDRPAVREVFAASFRDRIVHHLVVNAINPLLEKRPIYDCYACRVGKGTHFVIVELIAKTIRSHWAIENNMHWELDTVMKEDECAFTNKTAALNWSILSKVSLSFLRRYQQLLGNTAPSKKGLRKQMDWSFESMLSTVLLMMDADELSAALTLVPKENKG